MNQIIHKIGAKCSANKMFEAIATIDGLKQWWTQYVTGNDEVGGVLKFRFPENGNDFEIITLDRDTKVEWRCLSTNDDWEGTKIAFNISTKGDEAMLLFSHTGFKENASCVAFCNTKWAVFLLSLKHYLENGKGKPFPYDTQITCSIEET